MMDDYNDDIDYNDDNDDNDYDDYDDYEWQYYCMIVLLPTTTSICLNSLARDSYWSYSACFPAMPTDLLASCATNIWLRPNSYEDYSHH